MYVYGCVLYVCVWVCVICMYMGGVMCMFMGVCYIYMCMGGVICMGVCYTYMYVYGCALYVCVWVCIICTYMGVLYVCVWGGVIFICMCMEVSYMYVYGGVLYFYVCVWGVLCIWVCVICMCMGVICMCMGCVIIVAVVLHRSFVSNITAIPTQIMAVSEAEGASALYLNELTQSLLMEGRAIADRLEASFHPVNSNLHQQSMYILHYCVSRVCLLRHCDQDTCSVCRDPAMSVTYHAHEGNNDQVVFYDKPCDLYNFIFLKLQV